MSLDYLTYQDQLARLMATDVGDPNFSGALPGCIDYAEQRIYRDLNLLSTRVRDDSATLTANSRYFTLPTSRGTFITVTGVNVITPAYATIETGKRGSLASMTRNFVDYTCPDETAPTQPSVPLFYYQLDQATLVVGPAPDQPYTVEVIGTIRPTPLSSSNRTTFLTTYLPDLFIAASMVYLSGYARNFGSQADDPKMAQSWEMQYNALKESAANEETRRRYHAEVNPSVQPVR